MNGKSFYVVQEWMLTELHLKGNDLSVYAIIYGFSQDGNGAFFGGLSYLAKWTQSTKQGILKNLKNLEEKGLLKRKDIFQNGKKYVSYTAYHPVTKAESLTNVKEFSEKSDETEFTNDETQFNGYETEFNEALNSVERNVKQSLPNNINNIDIIKRKRETSFRKPTLEEIQNYCLERNNNIDAEQFFDFYESKDWKVGNTKMKNWQAAIRTWEKRAALTNPKKEEETPKKTIFRLELCPFCNTKSMRWDNGTGAFGFYECTCCKRTYTYEDVDGERTRRGL